MRHTGSTNESAACCFFFFFFFSLLLLSCAPQPPCCHVAWGGSKYKARHCVTAPRLNTAHFVRAAAGSQRRKMCRDVMQQMFLIFPPWAPSFMSAYLGWVCLVRVRCAAPELSFFSSIALSLSSSKYKRPNFDQTWHQYCWFYHWHIWHCWYHERLLL